MPGRMAAEPCVVSYMKPMNSGTASIGMATMERDTPGKSMHLRCRQGVQIREAFLLASFARNFKTNITITHEGLVADAKNLMEILWLGIRSDGAIEVTVTGEEAERALAGLESLLETGLPPMFVREDHSAAAAGPGRWAAAPDG